MKNLDKNTAKKKNNKYATILFFSIFTAFVILGLISVIDWELPAFFGNLFK